MQRNAPPEGGQAGFAVIAVVAVITGSRKKKKGSGLGGRTEY